MAGNERRVVIVTGGSEGIGAGLVAAFRGRGDQVVATAHSIEQTQDLDVVAVPGDIADPATAAVVTREAISRFGRIDTLVNGAGILIAKPFSEYTPDDFNAKLATNLAGFFYVTQRVLTQMSKQGSGHIVSITTSLVDHAIAGVPSALASLTRGAVGSATRALAIEFADRGIRVNAVSPGAIETAVHPVETYEAPATLRPKKQVGEIADVVDAVLFLESARFVTGEILHVDGAQSAAH